MAVIALLTDFGMSDIYVGVMKGVILGIAPDTQIIDITHAISPQNVCQGAFALLNSVRYFPAGTVFIAVVDPGVGSERHPLAAHAGDHYFVGPDNGLFSYVIAEADSVEVMQPDIAQWGLQGVSTTFHGRDVFAPVAAHLASGVPLDALGPPLDNPVRLPTPTLQVDDNTLRGEVVHIDHFGNVVTSLGGLRWIDSDTLLLESRWGLHEPPRPFRAANARITLGDLQLNGIRRTYAAVANGDLLALIGSNGWLEIAVNGGNAAQRLGAKLGDEIEVHLANA